jgi:hypothetical protein
LEAALATRRTGEAKLDQELAHLDHREARWDRR